MRYPSSHKSETHQRILETAAASFRKHGVDGIGVADLMKSVGLTHGGFYAHFESKDKLFAEAIDAAFTDSLSSLQQAIGKAPASARRKALIDAYLSARHRDHADRGCAIAALGTDIARQGVDVKEVLEKQFETFVDLLQTLSGSGSAKSRKAAINTIAAMVGAMVLARAVPSEEVSDEILAAVRDSLKDRAD